MNPFAILIRKIRQALCWRCGRRYYDIPLSAMTVNERLGHLGLFSKWDTAVAGKDRALAAKILRKCELPEEGIEVVIEKEFSRASVSSNQ